MSTPLFPTRPLSLAICAGVLLLAACESGELSAPTESQIEALSSGDLNASMTKVDVCHRTTTGDYTKISVADAAYSTHIDHGDGPVGAPIPGNEGYAFGYDCEPVPSGGYCPCYPTVEDLGELQGQTGLRITDSNGSWEATLTSGTASAEASFTAVTPYIGECAITQSDGSGKSYSPIRQDDANACRSVLELNAGTW